MKTVKSIIKSNPLFLSRLSNTYKVLLLICFIQSFISNHLSANTEFSKKNHIHLTIREKSPYKLGGISGHVSKRVLCALGAIKYNAKIEEISWKRAQKHTESGIYDAFFPAGLTEYRDVYLAHSIAVNHGTVYLYSNKNRTSNPEFIKMDKTVAIRGTKSFSWANNNLSNVIAMPDAMHIFKALDERRIFKAVLSDTSVNLGVSLGLIDLSQFNQEIAYQRNQYVFFSKKFIRQNPNFLTQFNSALSQCIIDAP